MDFSNWICSRQGWSSLDYCPIYADYRNLLMMVEAVRHLYRRYLDLEIGITYGAEKILEQSLRAERNNRKEESKGKEGIPVND